MRLVFVLLFTLVLSVACARPDPLSETLAIPEPAVPTPADDFQWRGDDAHLTTSSRVFPLLSVRGQVALLRLGNARVFADGGNGLQDHPTSPLARAFRLLLAESRCESAFLELSASDKAIPQLYGLAGLRLVAPNRFSALALSFRFRTDSVPVLEGCLGRSRTFADIIGPSSVSTFDISSGSWPRDLAGLPPGA